MVFFAKGASRARVTVFTLLVFGFLAGIYSWPTPYNNAIDWVNGKIDYYETLGFLRGSKPLHFDELLSRVIVGLRLHRIGITPRADFRLGLDLDGGAHLVYQADFSQVSVEDEATAMEGLRDVIERRVNIFGVSEPVVQINKSGEDWRLVVELAGVKDVSGAIDDIGKTPFLEFQERKSQEEIQKILDKQKEIEGKTFEEIQQVPDWQIVLESPFRSTQLTGEYLKKADVEFDQTTNDIQIQLEFNDEGAKLFEEITERNVEKPLVVFLDGLSIVDTTGDGVIDENDLYAPIVKEKIPNGRAVITGDMDLNRAKEIVGRFNAGALPVPINLLSQQTVGASLGKESLEKSIAAGIAGIILVIIFMAVVYRLSGLLAIGALAIYLVILLTLFKIFSVTLTLAGIAGFILSIGMAVDANILIFARMREERKNGKGFALTVEEGFTRAWPSIRDGHVSTLITTGILFWFGTGFVQGFALVLALGVAMSLFSAVFVTKNFLKLFIGTRFEKYPILWR